jgi:hypothetical protein
MMYFFIGGKEHLINPFTLFSKLGYLLRDLGSASKSRN